MNLLSVPAGREEGTASTTPGAKQGEVSPPPGPEPDVAYSDDGNLPANNDEVLGVKAGGAFHNTEAMSAVGGVRLSGHHRRVWKITTRTTTNTTANTTTGSSSRGSALAKICSPIAAATSPKTKRGHDGCGLPAIGGSVSARSICEQPAILRSVPRPFHKPHLVPRQPATALGWSMQKQRQIHGWTAKRTAEAFGCSASHISRVEHGSKPSRSLVQFYEDTFEADGLLLSLYEVVAHAGEDERRRSGGRRPRLYRGAAGDASTLVSETIPHGTQMAPGQVFEKTWRIKNTGSVGWSGRRLERQGPLTGPGLISSLRFLDVPDTEPEGVAEIKTSLKAPTYDCTSIAYFKMVDSDGRLCFPGNYQLGLDVLVRVAGQLQDKPLA